MQPMSSLYLGSPWDSCPLLNRDTPGQASALKVVLSGLPKGLIGLFTETMLFARTMGLHDEAMEICDEFYPGVMEVVARMCRLTCNMLRGAANNSASIKRRCC